MQSVFVQIPVELYDNIVNKLTKSGFEDSPETIFTVLSNMKKMDIPCLMVEFAATERVSGSEAN